jgi:hypothetical protein
MFDITTGEIGKVLRLNLTVVDESQDPPVSTPLVLSNASAVTLQYAFGSIFRPIGELQQKPMSIMDSLNGVVQYTFEEGDLDAPSGFPNTGKIEYVIKVQFTDGTVEYSSDIGVLTVKEEVGS